MRVSQVLYRDLCKRTRRDQSTDERDGQTLDPRGGPCVIYKVLRHVGQGRKTSLKDTEQTPEVLRRVYSEEPLES